EGRIAALWLPNAFLAAVILRTHRLRLSILIVTSLLANLAVNLLAGDGLVTAAALAGSNGVEVIVISWIVQKLEGSRPTIDNLRTLGSLLLGCLMAPVASSAIAGVALAGEGRWFATELLAPWILADGLGLMIVTPILLIGVDAWRSRQEIDRSMVIEWGVLLLVAAGATALIFGQSRFPLLFLACPIVIWAAFRNGVRGTAAVTVVICLVALAATRLGSGPTMLVRGDIADKLIALQLFLATSFAMGLSVAVALAERKAIRSALEASRDLNQSILDNLREVVFKTDATGHWIFLNPAWQDITGFTVEESLGWPTTKLLHEDDRKTARGIYRDIVDGGIAEIILHQRFYTASGNLRHIEVTVRRVVDAHGQFAGTAGNIRDVSDRVQHERALACSEARFRRMAEAAPVGIYLADAEGMVTYANPTWCRELGLTVEETLGTGWTRALIDHTPYENDPAFSGFHKAGDVRRRALRLRGADGGDLWVETVSGAEFAEDGTILGFVGAVID
ncbi:MAG TPA: PAS domain S-box protein, partial [Sphingomicrobium sp.]